MSEQDHGQPDSNYPHNPSQGFLPMRMHLPNGEWVDAADYAENSRQWEGELHMGLLQAGDLVVFNYDDEAGKPQIATFDVEEAIWKNLSTVGNPAVTLDGTLNGADLDPKITGKRVSLLGSGWGGRTLRRGVVTTGSRPAFVVGRNEYGVPLEHKLPSINHFEIFAPSPDDGLRSLEPNQLDARISPEVIEGHQERLGQIDRLMERFGFNNYDFMDCSTTSPKEGSTERPKSEESFPGLLKFEDEQYIAMYLPQRAKGNELVVFDKTTEAWTGFHYSNYFGEDMLQVASARTAGKDTTDPFDAFGGLSRAGMMRNGIATTTAVSSGRFGFKATSYVPSREEAAGNLQMPGFEWEDKPIIPEIEIYPGGKVTVPLGYPLSEFEKQTPGLHERLVKSLSVGYDKEDRMVLWLNDKEVTLPDADEEIRNLVEGRKPEIAPQAASVLQGVKQGRVRRKLGKLLRGDRE